MLSRHEAGIAVPPAAEPTWRSYCAMLASKEAHFSALQALDEKRSEGHQRTLAEIAHIDQLLAAHSACVADFSRLMRQLGASDKTAQDALLSAITQLNKDLGDGGSDN